MARSTAIGRDPASAPRGPARPPRLAGPGHARRPRRARQRPPSRRSRPSCRARSGPAPRRRGRSRHRADRSRGPRSRRGPTSRPIARQDQAVGDGVEPAERGLVQEARPDGFTPSRAASARHAGSRSPLPRPAALDARAQARHGADQVERPLLRRRACRRRGSRSPRAAAQRDARRRPRPGRVDRGRRVGEDHVVHAVRDVEDAAGVDAEVRTGTRARAFPGTGSRAYMPRRSRVSIAHTGRRHPGGALPRWVSPR